MTISVANRNPKRTKVTSASKGTSGATSKGESCASDSSKGMVEPPRQRGHGKWQGVPSSESEPADSILGKEIIVVVDSPRQRSSGKRRAVASPASPPADVKVGKEIIVVVDPPKKRNRNNTKGEAGPSKDSATESVLNMFSLLSLKCKHYF